MSTVLATIALKLALLTQTPWVAEGTIKEVSGGPGGTVAELKGDDGSRVTLLPRGDIEASELKALSSLRVRIRGEKGDPAAPGATYARVDSYEILDVGKGQVPRIGMLAEVELAGERRLVFVDETGKADFLPKGWGQKLSVAVGAKLWMVGTGSGETFQPTRFQLLRQKRKVEAQPQ